MTQRREVDPIFDTFNFEGKLGWVRPLNAEARIDVIDPSVPGRLRF
jgi:hypothetical protein